MTQIKDAARIIRNGRVTTPKALVAAVVTTCAASTCTEPVIKDGNFCSMTCALTPKPVEPVAVIEEAPMTDLERFFQHCERMDWFYGFSDDGAVWRRGQDQMDALVRTAATDPTFQAVFDAWRVWAANPASQRPTLADIAKETPVSDHIAPCPDMLNGCIDLECQVRKGIREHLLWNVAHQDRPAWSEACLTILERLLNDEQHGTQTPDFFLEATLEGAACIVGTKKEAHVQAPKAVLTTTTKAVRKPRAAKIPPRITDGQEHPVTEKITMTKAEMEAAISKAVEARIAERERTIEATPRIAPADKPVEVVTKKGGRAKVERATAQTREHKGVTLPAFIVSEALTVPALEVGEQSLDTLVSSKERSPYNKARFRLDATPVALDPEVTTYRVLMAEHERLMGLVVAKAAAKPTKAKKAKKDKAPKVAAVVDVQRLAKVAALVTTLGLTRDEAEALVK